MRLVKLNHSPNWYVEWREGGTKKRLSTGTNDSGKAEEFLKEFRLAYSEDGPTIWPEVPAVLRWYYEQHARKLPSAQQAHIAVTHLSGFLGATRVCDCKLSRQERYVEYRQTAGVSNETIRRELSVLGAAFNRAKKFEKIPGEPPPILTLPQGGPRERALTRDEAAMLLRRLRQSRRQRHLLLFTRLALATGARPGAILSLTWDRVFFGLDVIDFTLPGLAQTNKRRGAKPLPPTLKTALLRAQAKAKTDHVIEWGGKPVRRIIKAFRNHAEAIGLKDVTPNTQRHTFGTWAGNNGASPLLLSRQMDHARASTTERYVKLQVAPLREVQRAARTKNRGKRGANGLTDRTAFAK